MPTEPTATPEPCRLCGGDAGTLSEGAHPLCVALAAEGQPTPCLGHRCPTCGGVGRVAGAAKAVVFADLTATTPGGIARTLEAAFPVCPDCAGTRVRPHVGEPHAPSVPCDGCGAQGFRLTYVPGPRPQHGDVGDSGRRLCDGCLDRLREDQE